LRHRQNGFAARCEDVALPFRLAVVLFLGGYAVHFEGHSPGKKGADRTEGQSHFLTTGGKAVLHDF
jgi:hypothetical protein